MGPSLFHRKLKVTVYFGLSLGCRTGSNSVESPNTASRDRGPMHDLRFKSGRQVGGKKDNELDFMQQNPLLFSHSMLAVQECPVKQQ
ncbi:hypothetical protein TNCT_667291 [Trichonephila clavata]|uniref:Uncharacterized protein n=1 Tax=Trichonephila clavata TaxID=2740835 RepID=A0A8X6GGI9_TRICU|nr:hypothetical protein TNCT_667291 [Trichonephila clavata]